MGLLSLALPVRCAVCDLPGTPLCDTCRRRLVRIAPPVCERCGAPGAWPVRRCAECAGRRLAFARARGAIAYLGPARTLVSAWKERGRRDLAVHLAAIVAEVVARPDVDVVCFVPGDRERGLTRGHVPAMGIAIELGRLWRIDVEPLLRRVGSSPRQASLGLQERTGNVRGAFRETRPVPRRVCLVDDVYTSGSTVSACATVLRRAGASRVEAVCLARAVR